MIRKEYLELTLDYIKGCSLTVAAIFIKEGIQGFQKFHVILLIASILIAFILKSRIIKRGDV